MMECKKNIKELTKIEEVFQIIKLCTLEGLFSIAKIIGIIILSLYFLFGVHKLPDIICIKDISDYSFQISNRFILFTILISLF